MANSYSTAGARVAGRAAGVGGTVGLVAFIVFLALLIGLICAVYPASVVSKLAFLGVGAVAVIFAFAAAGRSDTAEAGRGGRVVINLWIFLMGACPAYVPFKFGPLPGLNPLRLTYAAILAFWVYGLVTSPRLRAALMQGVAQSKVVFCSLTAFIAWQLFCATIGDQPFFSIYDFIKVVLPAYLFYLVAMTFYRNWADVQRTAMALALGALVACIAGLVEWRTQTNVFTTFLPTDPEQLAGLGWILVDKARGGDYRVSGTFAHPLLLAEFLCMVLPLVLMLAAKALNLKIRVLALCFLPLLLVTIYLSYTRSSLIAAVTSLLVVALLFGFRSARQPKRPALAMLGWMTVICAVATAAALSGSIGFLARGRTAAEAGSSDARVYMLKRGQMLLAEHPVQGYGAGLSAVKIGRVPGQRMLTIDSYFLTVALESGFVGLTLFLLGMAAAVLRTMSAGVRMTGVDSWVLVTLASAIVASLIVKTVLSLDQNVDLLYLFVGISVVAVGWGSRPLQAARGDQAQSRPAAHPVGPRPALPAIINRSANRIWS